MKSVNFEFLRPTWPELATLGSFAEQYTGPDPQSALVKLRSIVEQMVSYIYRELELPKPFNANLNDLLINDVFRDKIPNVILNKFHFARVNGNKAAHGEKVSATTAQHTLREIFDLAKWFYVSFDDDGEVARCPEFKEPVFQQLERADPSKIEKERAAIHKKLAAQEEKMAALLEELEATRADAATAEKKAEDLEALYQSTQDAASALDFNEAETRKRLIDTQLVSAGWNVDPNGGNTTEVSQEEEVEHQPTDSGIGYADYILWDDNGKPLAVVEAKKTSVSPNTGRKQAQLYADGLEKMHGQRPVIFYTNGYEIWIWDDAQNYPPRKLYGFYSKDSLQYLVNFQRSSKKPLDSISTNPDIAGRLYQVEAIKRVAERFTEKHRKTLIVQATGTGKTRVAISLTDLLIRANWAKRVLFLCDRRELRKQAKNAYNDFLNEPIRIVTSSTAKDKDSRIYLATYPAMSKIFQSFDVGFFDLIIADESHRSIYNRYRDIFQYFDALQVGLTATPVDFINRNTFLLFGCQEKDPTSYYPLEKAVEEGHLVPFEVFAHTTNFLRKGIKYEDLTPAQRQQLEDEGEDPELFNFEAREVDKHIFNKETNRAVLRNLMENGLKDANGQKPGKSIIFARSHEHAILLQDLFDELYPQYGGNFCQVIDNYDPRAEQLIDDFKGIGHNQDLTIAISVDMLDTGIDIPEILNLVFAKPIKSKVKFWQMIGRGTRLCPDLFGPGEHKKKFRIFDHWGNFEFFGESFSEADHKPSKSLLQRVFEARIELAETCLKKAQPDDFDWVIKIIGKDIASLPDNTIAVRDKIREKDTVTKDLTKFNPKIVLALKEDIAPLMQWIHIDKQAEAYRFDLLMTRMQTAHVLGSNKFDDYKHELLNMISDLQMHLNPVKKKAAMIQKVQESAFWASVTLGDLEEVRKELRGIMQYRDKPDTTALQAKHIDISDGGEMSEQVQSKLKTIDMKAYVLRVEETLKKLAENNPVLIKIRKGQPVTEADLNSLTSMVLTQNPDIDLNLLKEFYEAAAPMDYIIRSIVGMDPDAVKERFAEFAVKHPKLTATQVQFLSLLQGFIADHGAIELERLYEAPFTTIDTDGLDGVFPDETAINELIAIIQSFEPQHYESTGEQPQL